MTKERRASQASSLREAASAHLEGSPPHFAAGRWFREPPAAWFSMHVNPDHFLETESGRFTTPERNLLAWEKCYEAFAAALARATPATKVYVLIGPQGAGKSTWCRSKASASKDAILFDAILVKRSERERILVGARAHSVGAIAVWFRTPLEICLARNASRADDELVPEQAIRNVHAAVEPPAIAEGFEEVIEILPDEADR